MQHFTTHYRFSAAQAPSIVGVNPSSIDASGHSPDAKIYHPRVKSTLAVAGTGVFGGSGTAPRAKIHALAPNRHANGVAATMPVGIFYPNLVKIHSKLVNPSSNEATETAARVRFHSNQPGPSPNRVTASPTRVNANSNRVTASSARVTAHSRNPGGPPASRRLPRRASRPHGWAGAGFSCG